MIYIYINVRAYMCVCIETIRKSSISPRVGFPVKKAIICSGFWDLNFDPHMIYFCGNWTHEDIVEYL